MNEIQFLHKNIKKWEQFDQLLNKSNNSNPDALYDLYIKLTDDLSYARTHFPDSEPVQYLNKLAQKAHGVIYQNQPINRKKIFLFWKKDFPVLVYEARREIFISFVIFFISVLTGIISNTRDIRFVNAIMGDSYVNMTQSNIDKGDPMAVYKSMNQTDMFLGITANNIRVSFIAFLLGIFSAFGTGYALLSNGIMLGTFHGFLAGYGLIVEPIATIWIHGTLEIFAIIVSGGAGIIMGNSLFYPGTYSRLKSFQQGVIRGLKIVIGLIPVFILAGFLEGFVTRYTNLPLFIRFSIIGLSLTLIVSYFYIYPRKIISKKIQNGKFSN